MSPSDLPDNLVEELLKDSVQARDAISRLAPQTPKGPLAAVLWGLRIYVVAMLLLTVIHIVGGP